MVTLKLFLQAFLVFLGIVIFSYFLSRIVFGVKDTKKPFIIISKSLEGCDKIHYTYKDGYNNKYTFCDTFNFEIGDTIK